jgi:hypothetical protein
MNKNACLALFLALGMGMPCALAEPLTLDPRGGFDVRQAAALPGSTLAPDPALEPQALLEPASAIPAPASFGSMADEQDLRMETPPQRTPPRERDLPEPVSAVLILLALSLLARAHRKQSD